jgi:hypothetical protein
MKLHQTTGLPIIIGGLAIFCLLAISGCKKDDKYRNIQLQVTIPANTTFDIRIVKAGFPIMSETNSNTNLTWSALAKSGDTLAVAYQFVTQGQQNGQGLATFSYNASVLLTINGGSGNGIVKVP